ncbi:transglycosylase domain-containing protein [Seinonella peptonophila]|nr:transglycosylase domain-containing protein [Seinonella peptonophila]
MDDFQRGSNPLSPLPARRQTKRVGRSSGKGGGGGFRRLFNWKWLLLVLLTTVLLIIGGCSALLMQGQTIDLDKMGKIDYSSTIYDKNGKPVTKVGKEMREFVKISDIEKVNPGLPEAFVKVEDARFYEHTGVDYYGLLRAVWENIKSVGSQGASTITMQVAGNVILENREKKFSRKAAEIATAFNLEKKYNKKQILEAYINYIAFGNGMYGIQMASKFYFGKDVTKDKLEPHEIAYLAGLPKAPYTYNCFSQKKKKRDKALVRRNVVLGEMAEDYIRPPIITKEQLEKEKAMPLGCKPEAKEKVLKSAKLSDKFAAYKEVLVQEIIERYGIPENDIASKGYRIYTGLDPKTQMKTSDILKQDSIYKNHNDLDGGSITLDPNTGLIAAVGGGRKYVGRGFLNQGAEVKVQPGSSIKPLTVYGPAVEESDGKVNENSILQDTPIQIGSWKPKNSHGGPKGPVPMMETVKNSLNLSTIHLLKEKVTLPSAYRYAQKFGLQPKPNDESYAPMALGGLTDGVSAIQMAQAYSVFVNKGEMIEAHTVAKITVDTDRSDEWTEIAPKREPKKEQIFKKKTAYYMTRMLKEVINSGTGTAAKLGDGRPVAGKTGTTNSGKEAYFVGYTPQYVTASFVYNTGKDKNDHIALSGGKYPAVMFKEIMDAAHKGLPVKNFDSWGIEDPPVPYQLKGPALSGHFDAGQKAIVLNWSAGPAGRVTYEIFRDGQSIGQTSSNSFVDPNIDVPNGGILGAIFGGKSYKYKVVATDTQTQEKAESNELTVKVEKGGDNQNQPPDCSKPENASKPECQNQPPDCSKPENMGKPECQHQDNGNQGNQGDQNNNGNTNNDGGIFNNHGGDQNGNNNGNNNGQNNNNNGNGNGQNNNDNDDGGMFPG